MFPWVKLGLTRQGNSKFWRRLRHKPSQLTHGGIGAGGDVVEDVVVESRDCMVKKKQRKEMIVNTKVGIVYQV